MITNLKFNNCFAFNNPVELSFEADMRIKKFSSNIFMGNENTNILKSIVIYGPNNTGKTTLMNSVRAIRDTLLNKNNFSVKSNIFKDNNICELGIEFLENGNKYYYEYRYDSKNNEYIYEIFKEIITDKYGNRKEKLILLKDTINKEYSCPDDLELENFLKLTAKNNILIYLVETDNFKTLNDIKNILINLANKIEIVDMNDIPNQKTIDLLKNKNNITKKTVELIKSADLYLDDYFYDDKVVDSVNEDEIKIANNKLKINQNLIDQIKLISVYKGKPVPSIIFDSLGTRKFAALASYIIEALEEGKILFIDELDSSLHFKITRAIISMFNNEINTKAQLIATLHDISLLDCKRMFRKDQIWFTSKDENETSLYSLKEFSYEKKGVRETTDIIEKYSKGVFGAIPEPNLISSLLEVDNEAI
jgi:AAA15 family ATPase/GTPase